MTSGTVEDLDGFRQRAGAWIRSNLQPLDHAALAAAAAGELDEEEELAAIQHERHLMRMMFDAGFAGITISPEYGGQGLSPAHQRVFNEELSGFEHPSRLMVPNLSPCAAVLLDFGTEEQKKTHIPAILKGEELWMQLLSEPSGGSDVAGALTTAVRDGDEWTLFGDKHFCSNVDADVFVVLARPAGAPDGTRGLATFIVPRRLPDGSANGFVVKRLKSKLGTIGVPTGEVTLTGARAWLAGAGPPAGTEGPRADPALDGRGLHRMMEMVNTSRFGVALMGLGIHRRSFLEAAIYAARRTQWGRRIDRYPLVRETLVDLLVDLEAGMSLAFECAAAVRQSADAEEGRLLRRLLVPLAKIRTTRAALGAASTALEVFGGNGYMADWPMARQLRDAQCHTIWEGTENILCIDVRRAVRGEGAHLALATRVERALDVAAPHRVLAGVVDRVGASLDDARTALAHLEGVADDLALLHGRRMAELLADVAQGALLLHDAAWSLTRDGDARKAVVARRFAERRLAATPVRGILSDDRTALDLFDAITRYGRVEADQLRAMAPAGGG